MSDASVQPVFRLLPLACACMLANSVFAQEHRHSDEHNHHVGAEPLLGETVEIKAAVGTDTFSKDVDTQYLSRTLAQDLQDSFKLDPSIQVGTGSRNGQKIFLRGVEDLHLNIQIDGARQGANVFHHQARVQIDPFLMKQVRVFTGPAQADAGPGALGGSVQFQTVDAQDLLQGKLFGARLGAQYESASDFIGGIAAAYGQVNEHMGILAYTRTNTNNEVRAGGGDSMVSTDGEHNNYLLKGSLLDYEGHSLRISTSRSLDYGGALRANYPWQTNQGTIRGGDKQRISNESHTLNYQFKPDSQPGVDMGVDLYTGEVGLKRFLPSGTTEWVTESRGFNLHNTSRFDTGNIGHALTYGVDYYRDEGISRSQNVTLTEHGSNTGLYIQNRMNLGAFRLSGGIRHDRYTTYYADQYKASGDEWSPNISGEWDLLTGDNQLTLFAGYGQSIRGGRLNQAGWLNKYTPDFVLGNNGKLDPESATQCEWGARWHTLDMFMDGDHAGFDISFYKTRIDDYLVTNGEGPTGVTDRIYNADGDVTSRGFDVRAHWGTQSLLMNLAYSHNSFRGYDGLPGDTTGASARMGVSTGDRLVLDTLWQVRPDLSLGYTLTAVERLTDVRPGRPEKPGYVVHDLQLQWQPQAANGQLELTLALENLFDKRYAEHSTVRVINNDGSELASWEAGRNLRLGLDWRF